MPEALSVRHLMGQTHKHVKVLNSVKVETGRRDGNRANVQYRPDGQIVYILRCTGAVVAVSSVAVRVDCSVQPRVRQCTGIYGYWAVYTGTDGSGTGLGPVLVLDPS